MSPNKSSSSKRSSHDGRKELESMTLHGVRYRVGLVHTLGKVYG